MTGESRGRNEMVFLCKVSIRPKIVDNFKYSYMNRTMYRIFANEVQVAVFSDIQHAKRWAMKIQKNGLIGTEYENLKIN